MQSPLEGFIEALAFIPLLFPPIGEGLLIYYLIEGYKAKHTIAIAAGLLLIVVPLSGYIYLYISGDLKELLLWIAILYVPLIIALTIVVIVLAIRRFFLRVIRGS